jgi:hypothetical protein
MFRLGLNLETSGATQAYKGNSFIFSYCFALDDNLLFWIETFRVLVVTQRTKLLHAFDGVYIMLN